MEDEAMAAALTKPPVRLWRTQIEIVDRYTRANGDVILLLYVMGRRLEDNIRIRYRDLPEHIQQIAVPGKILHAMCNVAAKNPNDLYFENWETQ